MSNFESWTGNLPQMVGRKPDPVGSFLLSLQTVLGRKLAKGSTIGRMEAEVLLALAQPQTPGGLADDD